MLRNTFGRRVMRDRPIELCTIKSRGFRPLAARTLTLRGFTGATASDAALETFRATAVPVVSCERPYWNRQRPIFGFLTCSRKPKIRYNYTLFSSSGGDAGLMLAALWEGRMQGRQLINRSGMPCTTPGEREHVPLGYSNGIRDPKRVLNVAKSAIIEERTGVDCDVLLGKSSRTACILGASRACNRNCVFNTHYGSPSIFLPKIRNRHRTSAVHSSIPAPAAVRLQLDLFSSASPLAPTSHTTRLAHSSNLLWAPTVFFRSRLTNFLNQISNLKPYQSNQWWLSAIAYSFTWNYRSFIGPCDRRAY